MRFLIDECCPRAVGDALAAAGHDLLLAQAEAQGWTDLRLAQRAVAEARIIVTEDYDFGELAARLGTPATGVILVACPALSAADRARRLLAVLAELGERLAGVLTIIEPSRVRRRPIG